jgi:hypothetical protein
MQGSGAALEGRPAGENRGDIAFRAGGEVTAPAPLFFRPLAAGVESHGGDGFGS